MWFKQGLLFLLSLLIRPTWTRVAFRELPLMNAKDPMVAFQNNVRQWHDAQPLVWSDTLAQSLTQNGTFCKSLLNATSVPVGFAWTCETLNATACMQDAYQKGLDCWDFSSGFSYTHCKHPDAADVFRRMLWTSSVFVGCQWIRCPPPANASRVYLTCTYSPPKTFAYTNSNLARKNVLPVRIMSPPLSPSSPPYPSTPRPSPPSPSPPPPSPSPPRPSPPSPRPSPPRPRPSPPRPSPPRPSPSPPSPFPPPATINTIVNISSVSPDVALDRHNAYRAAHGVPMLQWNTELEASAQRWANRCVFEHSMGAYGENLAWGQRSIQESIDDWYNEVKFYDYKNPTFSMATGHFTQVVWKSTKFLGCAMTKCNTGRFWVCQYYPPGNYYGQFSANVLPATGTPLLASSSGGGVSTSSTTVLAVILPVSILVTLILTALATRTYMLRTMHLNPKGNTVLTTQNTEVDTNGPGPV